MKSRSAAAFCLMFASAPLHSAEPAKETPKTITVDELNSLRIIGKLGIPLGKLAEIKGTIIARGFLDSKASRTYSLLVKSVAGRDLEETVMIPFRSPSGAPFPNSLTELYRMKKGREATGMTEEIMTEVEKEWVGSEVRFSGFESGSFIGLPEGVPNADEWPTPMGTPGGYHFESEVIVFSEI